MYKFSHDVYDYRANVLCKMCVVKSSGQSCNIYLMPMNISFHNFLLLMSILQVKNIFTWKQFYLNTQFIYEILWKFDENQVFILNNKYSFTVI